MKKLLIIPLLALFMLSCQQIFTYSPLSFLRRDVANLSLEQKKAYASELINSGDTVAMKALFDALVEDLPNDPADDPDAYLIAAELGIASSGFEGALVQVFALTEEDGEDALAEILNSIDVETILASAALLDEVMALDDADIEIAPDQYLVVGAALFYTAMSDENLSEAEAEEQMEKAMAYFELSGYSDLLDSFGFGDGDGEE